jgi:class 3 adenylate cyclase
MPTGEPSSIGTTRQFAIRSSASGVGVHTGEIEYQGDDIAGIAVHVAARVVALAEPGEILATSTVCDLAAGSLISFHDRGTHTLKGVSSPWRLFSIEI